MNLQRINKYVIERNITFTVDTADMCEVLGVSPETVRRLSVEMGMPKEGSNQYNLKECAKWYIRKLKQELNQTSNERLNKEKILLSRAKADEARLKVQILRKKVIPLEDLENQIILIISRFKDDLSNMSGSLSNQVASITKPAIAYELIEEAKNEALRNMATSLQALCEVEVLEEEFDDYDEFDEDFLFDEKEEKEETSEEDKETEDN